MCAFQLGDSRSIHAVLVKKKKKCAYFGLFVLFWATQVNKVMCDLQIKVAVAEGLLGLKEGGSISQ